MLIKNVLEIIPSSDAISVDSNTINQLTEYCTYAKWNGTLPGQGGAEAWQKLGVFSSYLIYPGTKWCGSGDIADSYEDLGPEIEADLCCRDHDHCEDSIPGRESKYGLQNNSPFTKSHCDCDDKFHQCLKEANTKASNRIGRIFFNFVQMECFRLDHPIIRCLKYRGWFRPTCQEYEFDLLEEPLWQFFDPKHYEPKSEEENEIEDMHSKDVFDFMLRLYEQEEHRNTLN
ncbi:phospholipase A2-like isoform X2 [Stegodyphus dumicola]|nr:phospholipase A2-like isoform X2 [Stegodyphus dumicola]